jgi:hypothetical protein
VEGFAKAIGRKPNLVGYYSGWNEPFKSAFAETAARHGADTIVQMDPDGVPLAKIASGADDSYLTSFANSVAAFQHPIVISFGREMNGFWYTWGYHHTPPSVFVAAWRHIVTLFRQHGATNVKWLWQVNSASPQTGPVRDWWPGAQYVTWVGVSGYYVVPTDTFSYIFKPVVAAVRQFTHDPVLIAETGVRPGSFLRAARAGLPRAGLVRREHAGRPLQGRALAARNQPGGAPDVPRRPGGAQLNHRDGR